MRASGVSLQVFIVATQLKVCGETLSPPFQSGLQAKLCCSLRTKTGQLGQIKEQSVIATGRMLPLLRPGRVTANRIPQQVEIAAIRGGSAHKHSASVHHLSLSAPPGPFAATLFVCVRLFLMSC